MEAMVMKPRLIVMAVAVASGQGQAGSLMIIQLLANA
jgi:hypothetical protein